MTITAQTLEQAKVTLPGFRKTLAFAFPHWGLWAAVLSLFLANTLWIGADARISIDPTWGATCILSGVAAYMMAILRCIRADSFDWFLHRMWSGLMTALMSVILMQNLKIFNHFVMTTNFPMADDRLLAWDRAIGFDWLAYAKFLTQDPTVTSVLFTAYNGMTFQGVIAVAALAILMNRPQRVIEISFLMLFTAVTCISIASFFPARAAMDILADSELLSRLAIGSGVYHLDQLYALRGNAPVHLVPETMQGLATFPSFHTCLGLLIMWGARRSGAASIAGYLLGAIIIAATPIYGGHYLVDVMGGALVVVLGVAIWHLWGKQVLAPSQQLQHH